MILWHIACHILAFLAVLVFSEALPKDPQLCQSAIGMEDGQIHNSQLKASSSYTILTGPEMGRLNRNEGHGAWCPFQRKSWYPNQDGGPYFDQYYQIHLLDPYRISAIGTQGRSKYSGSEMVKAYYVNYKKPDQKANMWLEYHDWNKKTAKKFVGNLDKVNVTKINRLIPPIMVNTIRIIPEIYPVNQVCMRIELYGCLLTKDLVSYTVTPGNARGPYNMTDLLFDGVITPSLLSSGLGMLTDGKLAASDFRENNGYGWIAWTMKETSTPFIIFQYQKAQVFRSMTIHSNIRTRSSVELFDAVSIEFSQDGMKYDQKLVHRAPDVRTQYQWMNYNVTVDLCLHTAKSVRLEFNYRGEWILISEVAFDHESLGLRPPPTPACLVIPSPTPSGGHVPSTPDKGTVESPKGNRTYDGVPVQESRGELDGGVIAGIVCAILLIAVILIVFFCWWRYKRRRHNQKPSFYHFIRWELKPFNSNSAHRVSRLCEREGSERGFSLKSRREVPAPDPPGYDPTGPIYASIHNLEEAGLDPSELHDKNSNEENGKPARAMSRGKPSIPKNRPPPLPTESTGIPVVEYVRPDIQDEDGPDYAEPQSPLHPEKSPLLSPTKAPKSPSTQSTLASLAPNPPQTSALEDDHYEKPVEKPLSGYSEPIDSLVSNEIFRNPVYEEVYSEPYQGVSGSTLYADPSVTISRQATFKEFPRERLHFKEKIGDGQFGEVHLGEVEGLGQILGEDIKEQRVVVAIKMLKAGVDKNIKQDFFKEVKIMAGVRHENVVRLLGVCKDDPMCMIVEYMENGDLNQFLKQRELASGNSADPNKVTYQALLYMALQLAAGMKYIASHQFVHRDLATRNCLVGHSFTVKIADFGMSRHLYSKHYYRIQGRVILPIRWMAPECILQGKFTSASDVWAFGVTLWEILTLAAEYPYGDLTDEKVIENVQLMFFRPKSDAITFLSRPEICPPDVYAKMRSCWAIEPSARPDFHDIHSFLENRVALSEMTI